MGVHHATVEYVDHKPWAVLRKATVVMVLQNERFYADFVEQMLAALGFAVAGAFCRCKDSEEWLETQNPDVAVIDAEVQDGRCREIARMLHARGVPFVVYSTMPIIDRPSDRTLERGIFLKKPSSRKKMLAAVQAALARREGN